MILYLKIMEINMTFQFKIEPNIKGLYNNISGGSLTSKFSIHEQLNRYIATSASGNSELISYLESLTYLTNKTDNGNYISFDVDPAKIISLQNAVMDKFK
jgi:hypothetical protein